MPLETIVMISVPLKAVLEKVHFAQTRYRHDCEQHFHSQPSFTIALQETVTAVVTQHFKFGIYDNFAKKANDNK